MFCQNCGKEVSEDVNFCPSCGKSLNQVEVKKESNLSSNKELSSELKKYHEHFSKISEVYNLSRIGNNLLNNLEWRKLVKGRRTGGIVMFVIGLVGFILTLIPCLIKEFGIFFFFTLGMYLFVIELILFTVGLVYMIKYGKHKSTIEFYEQNLPKYNQIILEHYKKIENCSLPIDYTDPAIIEQLISFVDSKRAETLKEAINLFEDECHKAEVRNELKAAKEAANQAAFASTMTAINTMHF